ncbi:MAG: hypothetical protein OEZ01_00170 [Candidatus Heimdallarchaeota archaeon]|nr:hypothetical protein [Candidatus Heimdallarchaeota archaeon]
MSSKLTICNMALISLGLEVYTNINDIEILKDIYNQVLENELIRGGFYFSIKEADLLKDIKDDSKFVMPVDFLSLVDSSYKGDYIKDGADRFFIPYCKIADMSIKYIARIDEEDFPIFFAELLSASLAREAAYSLTKDTNMIQYANSLYIQKVANARNSEPHQKGYFYKDNNF